MNYVETWDSFSNMFVVIIAIIIGEIDFVMLEKLMKFGDAVSFPIELYQKTLDSIIIGYHYQIDVIYCYCISHIIHYRFHHLV